MTILVRNVTQHYTVWSLEALNPRVLHRIGNSSNTDLILCCRSVSSLDPELNQPWTCARLGPLCAQGENGQGPNTGAIEDFESNGTWFHPEECLWWVDRSVPVPHLKQLYMLIPGPHAKAQGGGVRRPIHACQPEWEQLGFLPALRIKWRLKFSFFLSPA